MLPSESQKADDSAPWGQWTLAAPPPPNLCTCPPAPHETISCALWKDFPLCIFLSNSGTPYCGRALASGRRKRSPVSYLLSVFIRHFQGWGRLCSHGRKNGSLEGRFFFFNLTFFV